MKQTKNTWRRPTETAGPPRAPLPGKRRAAARCRGGTAHREGVDRGGRRKSTSTRQSIEKRIKRRWKLNEENEMEGLRSSENRSEKHKSKRRIREEKRRTPRCWSMEVAAALPKKTSNSWTNSLTFDLVMLNAKQFDQPNKFAKHLDSLPNS